jgi:hypothetical protein
MAEPVPPARVPYALLAVSVALAAVLFLHLHRTGSPAPYGVPLPTPKPKLVSAGVGYDDTDVLKGRIAPAFLEFLAPQPDGSVPLRYPYNSDRGDFSISHPMGTEMVLSTPEEFVRTSLDARGEVKYNQPLKQVRYLFPARRPKEKLSEYVARQRYELKQNGAKLTPDANAPIELPRFRFERLEYSIAPKTEDKQQFGSVSTAASGEEYHIRFIGPLGVRVLIADYVTTPELAEKGRSQAEKVIQSFNPGWQLYGVVTSEFPDYFKDQVDKSGASKPPTPSAPPSEP